MTRQLDAVVHADPRRWRALAVCLAAGFMCLLDITVVNVALPSVQGALGATPSALQWFLSGYALAFGLTLVPAGRAGDALGRRPVFLAGVVLFTVASALCGAAQSSAWMIAARLLQGAAAGVLLPQVTGLIQQLFSGRERGTAFGWFSGCVGVSMAAGPIVGGLLVHLAGPATGWRWVFLVNIPLGVVLAPLAHRLLPAPAPRAGARRDLDVPGLVLLGTLVCCLLLPVIQRGTPWPLLLTPPLLVGFVLWERRQAASGRTPLVVLSLFRVRSYARGTLLITLYTAGGTSILFLLPLYLQDGRGYDALAAGMAMSPFALGSAAASVLAGRLVHRLGARLISAGLALTLLGLGCSIAVVLTADAGWLAGLPLVLAGIGNGMVIAPNQTLTLAEVPVAGAGSAAAVVQVGQRVGSSVGVAVIGSVLFARLATDPWPVAYAWGQLTVAAFVLGAFAVAVLAARATSSD